MLVTTMIIIYLVAQVFNVRSLSVALWYKIEFDIGAIFIHLLFVDWFSSYLIINHGHRSESVLDSSHGHS